MDKGRLDKALLVADLFYICDNPMLENKAKDLLDYAEELIVAEINQRFKEAN